MCGNFNFRMNYKSKVDTLPSHEKRNNLYEKNVGPNGEKYIIEVQISNEEVKHLLHQLQ